MKTSHLRLISCLETAVYDFVPVPGLGALFTGGPYSVRLSPAQGLAQMNTHRTFSLQAKVASPWQVHLERRLAKEALKGTKGLTEADREGGKWVLPTLAEPHLISLLRTRPSIHWPSSRPCVHFLFLSSSAWAVALLFVTHSFLPPSVTVGKLIATHNRKMQMKET